MSKMTVKDEVNSHSEYERLKFVEFIEFLGRIAHTKFVDDTDTPLHIKIERILDHVLAAFGFKRKEVPVIIKIEESSDESVLEY